jgi:prepilin-type N-terminal cleavage/methylation domain-containing protein
MTPLASRLSPPASRRGFTVVEMIVASALLGIGIAASVACIGSATRASGKAEEMTAVELMAREKLAELRLRGSQEGPQEGDFGPEREGFAWRTSATEADVSGLRRVRLTILWGNPDAPKHADFDTYVRSSR